MALLPNEQPGYCHQHQIRFEDPLYAEQFLLATRQLLGSPASATNVIDSWAELVTQVANGYNATPPELEEALITVREPIDALLMEGSLHAFSEHGKFIKAVGQLDARFMELTFEAPLHPEDFDWYARRIPRRAGSQYIDFLPGNMKVRVDHI